MSFYTPIFIGNFGGGLGLWSFLIVITLLSGMMGIIATLGLEMFVCDLCNLPTVIFELNFLIGAITGFLIWFYVCKDELIEKYPSLGKPVMNKKQKERES